MSILLTLEGKLFFLRMKDIKEIIMQIIKQTKTGLLKNLKPTSHKSP